MKYQQIENAIIKAFNSNIKKSRGKEITIFAGTYENERNIELNASCIIKFDTIADKKAFDIAEFDVDMIDMFTDCTYLNNEPTQQSLYGIIDYVASFGGYIQVGDGEYSRDFDKATDLNELMEMEA